MEWPVYERRIEAIVFAAGDPIELAKISAALDIEENIAKHCIDMIRERYVRDKSPFDISYLGDAVQMTTLPEYAQYIRAALALRRSAPLSAAALEVLATIAYNQPVTRSFIEQVRGVDCSSIVRALAEKGLIEESGRLNIPGKPIAYRTTQTFLRCFGLSGIEQLPDLPGPEDEAADDTDTPQEIEGQMDFSELV